MPSPFIWQHDWCILLHGVYSHRHTHLCLWCDQMFLFPYQKASQYIEKWIESTVFRRFPVPYCQTNKIDSALLLVSFKPLSLFFWIRFQLATWAWETLERFSRAGPRGREWATLGEHPLTWLLSNNRLEKVPFVSVLHTSSNRLLLSNQNKACTPSVAHSLPLPLGPALLNLWNICSSHGNR